MLRDDWIIAHSRRHLSLDLLPFIFCFFRLATLALRLGVSSWVLQPSEVNLFALLVYLDDVVSLCSLSLRAQAWPAIEFVSGKEGLRPF